MTQLPLKLLNQRNGLDNQTEALYLCPMQLPSFPQHIKSMFSWTPVQPLSRFSVFSLLFSLSDLRRGWTLLLQCHRKECIFKAALSQSRGSPRWNKWQVANVGLSSRRMCEFYCIVWNGGVGDEERDQISWRECTICWLNLASRKLEVMIITYLRENY